MRPRISTWVAAGRVPLAVAHAPHWALGARALCMVPNAAVRLPAISRPELPEGPNRVVLEIRSMVAMADEVRLLAALDGVAEPVVLQVPARLVAGLGLQPGASVGARLREDRLHLLHPGNGLPAGRETDPGFDAAPS